MVFSSGYVLNFYDEDLESMQPIASYDSLTAVNEIRWSRDNDNVVRAGSGGIYALSEVYPLTDQFIFEDVTLKLNANVVANEKWLLKGTCRIIGNGYTLSFVNGGSLVAYDNSDLTIYQSSLKISNEFSLRCLTDTASIILRDSELILDRDFTFSKGSMLFNKNVMITGTNKFTYQSSMTSTVQKNSTLFFDRGITFSYDPGAMRTDLLCFEDASSILYLNNATLHATTTGMRLTKGTGIIEGVTSLESEIGYDALNRRLSGGIYFGDQTVSGDFSLNFLSGSELDFSEGLFIFKNVDSESWSMSNVLSDIRMQPTTTFELHESLDIGSGRLFKSNQSALTKFPGKSFTGVMSLFA